MQIKPGYTTVRRNATNSDLQRAIEAAIPQAVRQGKSIASRYKGKTEEETCKKIFDYLKNNINYKADGADQQVRLPSALMRTAQGDCKSYSVFTSGILSNLGIPHKLVYASYDPTDYTPSHIYVVTDQGCIIDAVYGKFNAEKKATYKKYKNMNIAYIAGVKPRKIGRSCGYSGIGATESGLEWGKRNGIFPYQSELWLSANNGTYRKYATAKVFPLAITGRAIVRKLIEKNAGGFATSLNKLMMDSRTQSKGQPAWDKMRAIELQWLETGGNPNELYESISEGAKKTATGQYFNKLMKMKAGGYTPNPAQWIAAGVSILFGKKYNEATGTIGDPATSSGLLASAPVWVQFVAYISGVIGTAYVVAKVGGPNDVPGETPPGGDGGNNGGGNGGGNDGGGSSTRSALLPILLIGGAGVAAYFYFNKKK